MNYLPERHGLTLAYVLAEAAAVAPAGRVILDTFELYHPVGTPDGPVYVVHDQQNLTAILEADAARNAGQAVEFLRCNLEVERAAQSASNPPELAVSIGDVQGVMLAALRAARGSLHRWEVVHREYASDDPSAPVRLPPMRLYLVHVDIGDESVTFRASFGDSGNVQVLWQTFQRRHYPTLVR